MEEIKIRKYTNLDLTQVYDLLKSLEAFTPSSKQIDFYSVRDIFNHMLKFPNIYENYIAELNGVVVGYISMILYKSPFNMGGTVKINELVVKKDQRGKSVGTKLIKAAIESAKQSRINGMEIGTELNIPTAQDFYRKMGFENKYSLFGMKIIESKI